MAKKVVFFVSDGYLNNLISSITLALEAKKADMSVSVVVTEAAIPLLLSGSLKLAEPLESYAQQIRTNLKNIVGSAPKGLAQKAFEEGVELFVSEPWLNMLGMNKEAIPPPYKPLSLEGCIDLIKEADLVIGKV